VSEKVLKVLVHRHVFDSDRPFSAVLDGIFGGISRPDIEALFSELAASTSYEQFSAIGPLAGGALIAAFGTADGWRAVFYVNVPIGLALCPFAVMLLPRHVRPAGRRPGLDRFGAGLLGLGIVLILLPFIENGWGTWRWSLLGAAAADLALFIRWEQCVTDPVLDLRLFRDRSYTTGISGSDRHRDSGRGLFQHAPRTRHLPAGLSQRHRRHLRNHSHGLAARPHRLAPGPPRERRQSSPDRGSPR